MGWGGWGGNGLGGGCCGEWVRSGGLGLVGSEGLVWAARGWGWGFRDLLGVISVFVKGGSFKAILFVRKVNSSCGWRILVPGEPCVSGLEVFLSCMVRRFKKIQIFDY